LVGFVLPSKWNYIRRQTLWLRLVVASGNSEPFRQKRAGLGAKEPGGNQWIVRNRVFRLAQFRDERSDCRRRHLAVVKEVDDLSHLTAPFARRVDRLAARVGEALDLAGTSLLETPPTEATPQQPVVQSRLASDRQKVA
jgi:hypothetical protein